MNTIFMKLLLLALIFGNLSIQAQQASPVVKTPVDHFLALDSIKQPDKGMILFVGSSSITKWQDIQDYFPGYKILNRGFGGSQFPDLIRYADKVIYPYQPSKIFIYEGDNDLSVGRTPEQIIQDAKTLRELIAKNLPGIPVVFISVKPSIARWKLKEKALFVNYQLKKYASETKLTQYADVWSPMIGKNAEPLPIFVSDGLHMTADGYKIWQRVLRPFLE